MAENEVSVQITVEEKQALAALARLTKGIDDFSDTATKGIKKSDMAWASFVGNFAATAVTKGIGLIVDGFQAFVGIMGESISEASEAQQAVNSFNLSLAQTGIYSASTSKELLAFAQGLQASSKYSDEAVLSTATLIQNIAKLGKEDLKTATQATVDFASAFKLDLDTAARVVGKALEGNVDALKRYGIEVEKGKTDTQNFANVMGGLSSFQGRAAGEVNTFAGAIAQQKNVISELQEALGQVVVENPAVIGMIKAITYGFQIMGEWVKENQVLLSQWVTSGVRLAIDAIGYLAVGIQTVNQVLSFFAQVSDGFMAGLSIMAGLVLQVAEGWVMLAKAAGDFIGIDTAKLGEMEATLTGMRTAQEEAAQSYLDSAEARQKATEVENEAISDLAISAQEKTTQMVDNQIAQYQRDKDGYLEAINAKHDYQVQKMSELELLQAEAAQRKIDNDVNDAANEQLKADTNYQFLANNLGQEEALREIAKAKELENQGKHDAAVKSLRDARTKAEKEQIFTVQEYEKLSNKQRLANLQGTLGYVSSLMSSSNDELFAIGKAAAIGTATIDGLAAVQKALAAAPPPVNFVLAALVGVAAAANIAKIASTQKPKFAQGGIVGGTSYHGDNVDIGVNSKEMILNQSQQAELFNIAKGSGGSGGNVVEAINSLGDRIANMNIVVQANSREIARLVRDERAAGFAV